jgi:CD109 antigen
VSKQETNGKFIERGRIYDTDLPGQSSEGIALTAYVALAFAEANLDSDIKIDPRVSSSMNLALDYVSRNLEGIEDPYAVALITYVLTRADHPLKQGAFNILEGLAKISGTDRF